MRRLIVIALILAGIAGAALGVHIWDTQFRFYRYSGWIKVHYLINQDAFDRLSEKFVADPLVEAVSYFPPGSLKMSSGEHPVFLDPAEQAEYDRMIEEAEAQQIRYEPFIADLNFPGPVGFFVTEHDPHLVQNFGPGANFGYVLMASFLVHAEGVDSYKSPCPANPLDQPTGDCAEHLGGNWWMRYTWSTWVPEE